MSEIIRKISQWSAEETNALLAIWSSREIQDKLESSQRKSKVYAEIREEMEKAGFARTTEQIINKLKKIKKDYRDYKKENSKSGAGRTIFKNGVNFEVLDSVLGHRPANQLTGALNSVSAAVMFEVMCESPGTSTADLGKFSPLSNFVAICLYAVGTLYLRFKFTLVLLAISRSLMCFTFLCCFRLISRGQRSGPNNTVLQQSCPGSR